MFGASWLANDGLGRAAEPADGVFYASDDLSLLFNKPMLCVFGEKPGHSNEVFLTLTNDTGGVTERRGKQYVVPRCDVTNRARVHFYFGMGVSLSELASYASVGVPQVH